MYCHRVPYTRSLCFSRFTIRQWAVLSAPNSTAPLDCDDVVWPVGNCTRWEDGELAVICVDRARQAVGRAGGFEQIGRQSRRTCNAVSQRIHLRDIVSTWAKLACATFH